jgi:hypothetical protein
MRPDDFLKPNASRGLKAAEIFYDEIEPSDIK